MTELLMARPFSIHVNLAGGYEPEVSHLQVCDFAEDISSLGVTIFTLVGRTENINIYVMIYVQGDMLEKE